MQINNRLSQLKLINPPIITNDKQINRTSWVSGAYIHL